jgi:quercetin dioxygenase-like cupin family protein
VISGVGRFQAQDQPIREIKAGDVIWIPTDGTPTTGTVHIATQEALDGENRDLDGARHRR